MLDQAFRTEGMEYQRNSVFSFILSVLSSFPVIFDKKIMMESQTSLEMPVTQYLTDSRSHHRHCQKKKNHKK